MPKGPKFYAVRIAGKTSAVYNTWAECEKVVKGVSGAVFKGFPTREEAQRFLDGAAPLVSLKAAQDELRVFVDGSFIPPNPYAGWGFVVVRNDEEIFFQCGRTSQAALSRNIDGELEASLRAIAWLCEQGEPGVIVHDYEGIARWALGEWKATSQIAKYYVQKVQGKLDGIRFCKVAGHSGNRWNDRADALAKQGLQKNMDLSSNHSQQAVNK